MQLNGKVAIVTGAASGFGAEIAKQYVAEGARVMVADRNGDGAKTVAAALGDAAVAVTCDVTQEGDIRALVDGTLARFGQLDIVVNNAGTTHRNQPLMDVSEEWYDRCFDVNVKSIFHMTRAVVPHWRQRGTGGVMLNVGSTAGIRPRPGLTWYNASKGAVNLMSKSLAVELGPDRVRVNCICPVMGESALLESFMGMEDTPENRKKFIATIPMGRLARPSDVAAAAVFLASDAAEFISGVEFPVDGGRTV